MAMRVWCNYVDNLAAGMERGVPLFFEYGFLYYLLFALSIVDAKTDATIVCSRARPRYGTVSYLLLTDGVDPESRNSDGRTPLALAAGSWKGEVVRMLLDTRPGF